MATPYFVSTLELSDSQSQCRPTGYQSLDERTGTTTSAKLESESGNIVQYALPCVNFFVHVLKKEIL
jgi:hypothetical protein